VKAKRPKLNYEPGVYQQKWLQMGFELMPAPIKDVLWIEATSLKAAGFSHCRLPWVDKSLWHFIYFQLWYRCFNCSI